jgi:hypothetical protein
MSQMGVMVKVVLKYVHGRAPQETWIFPFPVSDRSLCCIDLKLPSRLEFSTLRRVRSVDFVL